VGGSQEAQERRGEVRRLGVVKVRAEEALIQQIGISADYHLSREEKSP